MDYLTFLPIVEAMKRTTAEAVLEFMCEKMFPLFGALKTVVSDSATCFTAGLLWEYIEEMYIKLRTVLFYAPIFNGLAEKWLGQWTNC